MENASAAFEEFRKFRDKIMEDARWGADSAYGSLLRVQDTLASAKDPVATYELALECLEPIIGDLEEHGADNEAYYGDNGLEYFQELKKKYAAELDALKRKGVKSGFSDALKAQREAAKKLLAVLEKAEGDPGAGFAEPAALLEGLKSVTFLDSALLKEIQEALDSVVRSAIRSDRPAAAVALAGAYLSSIKTEESPSDLINNVLVAAVNAKDAAAVRAFLPHAQADLGYKIPNVHYGTLQYNIACAYAFLGDKAALCRYAERGTWNGKKPSQYLADTDFAAFVKDPEFLAALASGEKQYKEWDAAWQEKCKRDAGG